MWPRRPSAILLFSVEDGDDLGQCLVVADVAGEDDVGHADGLGCGVNGAEERDHAREQLAGYLGAADAQAVQGDVWEVIPPLAMTQAGSAASARRTVRDRAAETARAMARLPAASRPRTRVRLV